MNTFSQKQTRSLQRKLDRKHVRTRDVNGKSIDYIEGWFAIHEANTIFGYAGWDREVTHFERVYEHRRSDSTSCGYLARVRIRVRSGETLVVREGSGWGSATAPTTGEAYERALKAAETDGTKRALATFGYRFGLGLYDREQSGVTGRKTSSGAKAVPRLIPLGYVLQDYHAAVIADGLSAESFCSGFRQLLQRCASVFEVGTLQEANKDSFARLASGGLKTADGTAYSELLERALDERRHTLDASFGVNTKNALDANTTALNKGIRPASASAPSQSDEAASDEAVAALKAKTAANYIAIRSEDIGLGRVLATSEAKAAARDKAMTAMPVSADLPAVAPAPTNLLRPSRIADGPRIDKSVLAIGTQRRLRDAAHLKSVAAQPCLICGRQPSHAHHLTFAQGRGVSLKVSDEYTVPLCPIHHHALHRFGNERAWWQRQNIDPLPVAAELWSVSRFGAQASVDDIADPPAEVPREDAAPDATRPSAERDNNRKDDHGEQDARDGVTTIQRKDMDADTEIDVSATAAQ